MHCRRSGKRWGVIAALIATATVMGVTGYAIAVSQEPAACEPGVSVAVPTLSMNIGGPEVVAGGKTWVADRYGTGGHVWTSATTTAEVANTDLDVLFRTERAAPQLAYTIPVENGSYLVRLYVAEIYWNAPGGVGPEAKPGKRIETFNIEGGHPEVVALNPTEATGGALQALTLGYTTTVAEGTLTIEGTGHTDFAALQALEIFRLLPCTRQGTIPTPTTTSAATPQPASPVTTIAPAASADTGSVASGDMPFVTDTQPEAGAKTTYYVSPSGSDSNAGTQDKPFLTLAKARDVVRALRASNANAGKVVVYLRAGSYRQQQTLNFTSADSGSAGGETVVRSHPGEVATLTGGVTIPATQVQPTTNARIPASARDKVRQVDLAALGITDIPAMPATGHSMEEKVTQPELFLDGKPMTLARFPNTGFLKTSGSRTAGEGSAFTSPQAKGKGWNVNGTGMVFGYLGWEWADASLPISSFDAGSGAVTTSTSSPYGIKDTMPYYFFNVLEELDTPGEYYIDRTTKTLYYYPPTGVEQQPLQVSTLDKPVIQLDATSHVVIKNLAIQASRSDAIYLGGSSNVAVNNVVLRGLGKHAVAVEGGKSVTVANCTISYIGFGAIILSGGDRASLTAANLTADHNTISHFSRIRRTVSPAVGLFGVGNRATHNNISNGEYLGIQFTGNDHVIEYNTLFKLMTETGDGGAIYTGRNWTEAGNKIRYNYIHDIGNDLYNSQIGVYLDDMASGTIVEGNIIARTDYGFLLGGGHNNTFINNVMINTKNPFVLDARGLGWASAACNPGGVLQERLGQVPYQSDLWRSRYPWLPGILGDQPCAAMHNSLTRNVYYKSGEPVVESPAATTNTISNNWQTNTDPGFADAGAGNYQFRADAPVFGQISGFQALPFAQMGRK